MRSRAADAAHFIAFWALVISAQALVSHPSLGTNMSHQKMPVAYVAGPYRSTTRTGIELNIQSARQVGLQVARKGWSPLVPHANTGHLDLVDPQVGDQFWLGATMELMRRCDAVVLAPGWEHSDGTAAEIHEARRLGLPVFETVHALPCADTWRQQEEIQLQPAE